MGSAPVKRARRAFAVAPAMPEDAATQHPLRREDRFQGATAMRQPLLRRIGSVITQVAAGLLCATAAHSATPEQVDQFSALLKSRVTTPDAIAAVRDTPPAEYARWGEEVCNWVRIGKANFPDTQANLASFFGDDLSAAIVFAARQVICPDLQ
jgi:hypothetical protein